MFCSTYKNPKCEHGHRKTLARIVEEVKYATTTKCVVHADYAVAEYVNITSTKNIAKIVVGHKYANMV